VKLRRLWSYERFIVIAGSGILDHLGLDRLGRGDGQGGRTMKLRRLGGDERFLADRGEGQGEGFPRLRTWWLAEGAIRLGGGGGCGRGQGGG
jgi:hypothetical protein